MVVNSSCRRPNPQEYNAQQASIDRAVDREVIRRFDENHAARQRQIDEELRREQQQVERIRQEVQRLQAERLRHENQLLERHQQW
jgi:TolA-binding protein